MSSLFRKKSLDLILADAEEPEHQMKRTLGPLQLIALGIGAIVGAGIFATIGTAAAGGGHHDGAGPALVVSILITAIGCGFCALCYAEFASLVPIAGSAYTYSYATLGELVAWIIGWDLIIEYAMGNVAVAVTWSGYFVELMKGLGDHDPRVDVDGPGDGAEDSGLHGRRPPRLRESRSSSTSRRRLITLLLTWLLVIGIKESAPLQHGDGRRQARDPPVLHHRRRLLRQAGQLASVRSERLDRHRHRRGPHLLRLHRVRRRLDRGRGVPQPAEGHADRHDRVARDLHRPLHRDLARPDRHRAARQHPGLREPLAKAFLAPGA